MTIGKGKLILNVLPIRDQKCKSALSIKKPRTRTQRKEPGPKFLVIIVLKSH